MADLEWLEGGVTAVPGILAGGVAAGIKPSGKNDLALVHSPTPARVAAVFTSNQVKGAPVIVSGSTPGEGWPRPSWLPAAAPMCARANRDFAMPAK